MASPAKTGGGQSSSDVPRFKQPFDIETDVDIVQPAGSYNLAYAVGRLSVTTAGDGGEGGEPAVEIISTATTGPARYRLPDPFPGFTDLMLPLLGCPKVKVTVETFIPRWRAITRAKIVVQLLGDTLSDPARLRRLYAAARKADWRRQDQERRVREKERRVKDSRPEGEPRPRVDLLPELARKVIGMLPWNERLWSTRLVSKSWREAADAVTPAKSYTARVHKQCHGRPATAAVRHGVGVVPQGPSSGNPGPSPSPSPSPSATATPPLSASSTESSSGGTNASGRGSSGGGGPAPVDRDVLPSRSWLRESRFTECSGEAAMGLLEGGVRSLERMAEDIEGEELCLAATQGGDGGLDIDVDVSTEGEARVQCRRLRSFLAGVRALCVKHGISCGADELEERVHGRAAAAAAQPVVSPPFGVSASAEVVAAVSAAVARTSEAGSRPSPSSGGDSGDDHGPGHGHDRRWDGWLVFAMAVTLAASEDRPFLCRCALQSVWGEAGLPRTQMIELLSKAFVALQPVKAKKKKQAPAAAGFQAASGVVAAETERWDGTGSYRLRNDLLQCIYALESYFVRFVRTPDRAEDGDGDDAGFSQSSSRSQTSCRGPRLVDLSTLTNEQRSVVSTRLEKGQTLKVVAYAGTGKTVTLRAFAQAHPELKILYVAFNRSVADSARDEFPRNTECRTMNSISMTGGYHGEVKDNVKEEVYAFLKQQDGTTPYAHAMIVHRTIVKFCQSGAPTVSMDHVWVPPATPPSPYKTGSRSRRVTKPPTEKWVLERALEVWERMHPSLESPGGPGCGGGGGGGGLAFPKTFDSVLKVYQLSRPDLSPAYDVIMLDEAQDINACQADIISRQTKCRVIVVGDPHQAIYGWRGAKGYLKQADCFKELRLTQCFRFGTSIASVGNTLLLELKREKRPLLGSLKYSDGPTRVLFEQDRLQWFSQLDSEQRGRYAFIARTNAGLIREAMASIGRGDRVAIEGGPGKLELKDVRDVCYMMMNDMHRVKNPELKEMGSISMLRRVLEDTDDAEIKAVGVKLNMVEELMESGKSVHDILADVNNVGNMKLSTDTPGPLMILTTVHKAKGLEFDTVVLADDFSFEPLVGGRENLRGSGENANLLYVAVTRAKRQLFLNPRLAGQLRAFGMWDSLALQGTSWDQALRVSPPRPCHSHGCDCTNAHGVSTEAPLDGDGGGSSSSSSSDGEGFSQAPRLFYAGSGSIQPLCRACVEGEAEEEGSRGKFPYALKLSTPQGRV